MSNVKSLTPSEVALKKKCYNELSSTLRINDGLEIRKLKMKSDVHDQTKRVREMSLGSPSMTNRPTKVILLIGGSGVGKSTFVNAMVNFIFRVEFEDDFRLMLIDDSRHSSESQTQLITAYKFNYMPGMPSDNNYILIDTPGFGDSRGIVRDKELMHQLEEFLQQDYGFDHVDAVGYVAAAAHVRLTPTQRYIMDGLLAMFGRNIQNNIFIMATFADNCKPPVLDALKDGNFKYRDFFKFNNSAIYSPKDTEEALISKLYWQMGYKNIDKFFTELANTTPVSLNLTRQVLEENRKLQTIYGGLQNQIQIGLSKLSNLHQEKEMLLNVINDVEGYKDYEVEVDVPKVERVLVPDKYIEVKQKIATAVNPMLSVLSGVASAFLLETFGLPIPLHFSIPPPQSCREKYKYETTMTKEKRTVQELYDRYDVAVKGKKAAEIAIVEIEKNIKEYGDFLVSLIRDAQNHSNKINDISLRPNVLSAEEYIDHMIMSEETEKTHNYSKRTRILDMLKTQALKGVANIAGISLSQEGGVQLLELFQNMVIQ